MTSNLHFLSFVVFSCCRSRVIVLLMAIIQLLQEPLESRALVELGRMLRQPQWRWHCASARCRCDAEGHAWRPEKKKRRHNDTAGGMLYCIEFQGLILKVFKLSQKVLWTPWALGTMYVCIPSVYCIDVILLSVAWPFLLGLFLGLDPDGFKESIPHIVLLASSSKI